MATMKQSVGAVTAFSLDSNLDSLADATAEPLGEVDNSSNDYPGAKVHLIINLASSGLDELGTVEVYLLSCLGTSGTAANWTDGIDGDATADQASNVKNSRLIKVFVADVSMQGVDINWVCNDLCLLLDQDGAMVGDLPPHWALLIFNKSGAALSASGHTANYQTVSYET